MRFTSSSSTAARALVISLLGASLVASCDCGEDEAAGSQRAGDGDGSGAEDRRELRARVERLIEQERYDEAIEAAEQLSDGELERLSELASKERGARRAFEEACMEIDGRNLAAVHEACNEIDGTSRYRDTGCCSGAAERLGEDRLRATLDQAETEGYQAATKSALALAGDETMPEYVREEAEAIADDLKSLPDSGVAGGGGGLGDRSRRRVRRSSKRSAGADEELSMAEESFAARAIRQARTALSRGDNRGCISALRGAPRSAGVTSLLITCYVREGDVSSACTLARRNPQVERAREFYEQRCR